MLAIIILAVFVSVAVSAFCSMAEASILSVTRASTKSVADAGSKRGKLVLSLKENTPRTIAALLIMNTIANTVGPAIVGAQAQSIYGDVGVVTASMAMTLLILIFGEMLPKQLGFAHNQKISLLVAYPIDFICRVLSPLVKLSSAIVNITGIKSNVSQVSTEEVLALAEIGTREGALDSLEGLVIKNIVHLDEVLVRDVLTPRVVVFRLEESTKLSEIAEDIHGWQHTRIPLYRKEDPDHVTHYVIQRDICRALLKGNFAVQLREIARPLHVVPELTTVDTLLSLMVAKGEHIAAAVDEHGGFAGVVTLEDIIEEVVGKEIIDEYDLVEDMRKHAENLSKKGRRGLLVGVRGPGATKV